jgi:simple sugar transport system permease protein
MKHDVSSPAMAGVPMQRQRPRIELARFRDLALLPALALLLAIGAFVSPSFLTQANLISILGASAALALVVLAESLIVLTGKFDLSLESTVGIAPAVGAMLVMPAASAGFGLEWPVAAGLAAIVVVGALIGFVNGFLVVRLRLNAFIVTLAMLIVLRGMLVGATKGGTLFDMPPSFFTLATTLVLGLPVSVWLAAVAFGIAAFMLRYHRLGRALYAIGGNPQAARVSGIDVDRVLVYVYVICGFFAGLAGLLLAGRTNSGFPNAGIGIELDAIAAVIIGGASFFGGRGTVLGVLSGVIIIGLLRNGLNINNVSAFWQMILIGVVIILAVYLDVLRRKAAVRR